jgi:hypothetical protein
MQGSDLAVVLHDDRPVREAALFGIHGGHVNVTDGRYVYMRAAADPSNGPLEDYTLMPTHMRSRFDASELACWEPAPPFSFTKGLRTMRVPVTAALINSWLHGTLLFDLHADPGQEHPLVDDEIELRMLRLLARLMHDSDAPPSQFQRLGIPHDRDATTADLLVRVQRAQAEATAEPVPPLSALPAAAPSATSTASSAWPPPSAGPGWPCSPASATAGGTGCSPSAASASSPGSWSPPCSKTPASERPRSSSPTCPNGTGSGPGSPSAR